MLPRIYMSGKACREMHVKKCNPGNACQIIRQDMALLKRFLVQKKKQTCKLLKSFLSVFPILVILSSSSILWFIVVYFSCFDTFSFIMSITGITSVGLTLFGPYHHYHYYQLLLPLLPIIIIITNHHYHYYQLSLLPVIIIIIIITQHHYQYYQSLLSLLPIIIIRIIIHAKHHSCRKGESQLHL